jgi:hypothetical protein
MSSAQALSGFAADAPRYGVEPASAYYALHDAQGGTGVDAIIVNASSLSGDVTLAAGTGITLTPTGNAVTITASGAGVASVSGTANQIAATTAAGAVTLALAAPSPAPTAGSYTAANITVDALGRVTAAANGPTALQNVLYFDISGGTGALPAGAGDASKILPPITGLTAGKSYMMSLQLVVGLPVGGISTFQAGSGLRFTFQNSSGVNALIPLLYPATDASYSVTQLPELYFATMAAASAGGVGTNVFDVTFSGIVKCPGTALSIIVNNTSTTAVTGALTLLQGNVGGSQSYIQLQQLD